MLNPYNEYLVDHVVKETTAKYRHEAEVDYLLDQLSLRRPSWFAQSSRRALQNLGHVLVALGRRLETRSA